MDPFAAALDAMFVAPGSIAANYQKGSGWSRPIRTVRSQPDVDAPFGKGRVNQGTNVFEFRKSEIPDPAEGDLIVIDFDIYVLTGDPMLDVEGLTWRMGAYPQQ